LDQIEQITQKWRDAIWEATQTLKPITPASLSTDLGQLTPDQAYEVQAMIVDKKIENHERVVGWKVGATSQAVVEQLKGITDEPVFGCMTSRSVYTNIKGIAASNFCRLGFEGEIALIMDKPLKGPGVTDADVIRAAYGAAACVELIDSRIKGRGGPISESIADNSGHGGFILGQVVKPLLDLDLRYEGVASSKNGRLMGSGCGCEALGNPIHVVTWLANKLSTFKRGIEAGDIITTGSLTRFFLLQPGDVVDVSYTRLGSVQFYVEQ
jgi:2-keto-4-pentenoate hydratase